MTRFAATRMSAPSAGALREAVDGSEGFAIFHAFGPDELATVRAHIETQWLAHLRECVPEHADAFCERGMARYHELAHLVDHATLWPKRERILGAAAVEAIRATSLCRTLEDAFGRFEISDEETPGREEIYWRLVRPTAEREMAGPTAAAAVKNAVRDTGPVHADRWFWDLGHGCTPAGVERVKVWAAVVTEAGLSGLQVLPGSHRRQWRYHGEVRDGFVKPTIDEDVEQLGLQLLPTEPGDAVVFNDCLLHGGGDSRGAYTRVSFEFTMFVRRPARATP